MIVQISGAPPKIKLHWWYIYTLVTSGRNCLSHFADFRTNIGPHEPHLLPRCILDPCPNRHNLGSDAHIVHRTDHKKHCRDSLRSCAEVREAVNDLPTSPNWRGPFS